MKRLRSRWSRSTSDAACAGRSPQCARDGEPLPPDVRCRWVYAHSDLGFAARSSNACVVELFIDPDRTRLSRFDHDRWMSLDVIVTRDGERVGFASTKLRYVDE